MSREKVLVEAESLATVEESQVSEETKEQSRTENGVYIKGKALPFGEVSRNGVQYDKESVKETHDQLHGRPMLFNHKEDHVAGHILNTEITEEGMFFEGDINPNAEMPNGVTVAEAIERGDINSVSIQAFVEELDEETDEDAVVGDMQTVKAAVRDWIEISAVTTPGFTDTSAVPEHLRKQGVKAVTEVFDTPQKEYSERDADDFDDVGECISFHMNQMDMDQDQAVAVCMDKMESEESLEDPEFEVGDFVKWEFGDGSSQGEIIDMTAEVGDSMSAGGNEFTIEEGDGPLYKIEEWDETAGDDGEFTNNVVKFEDELSSTDRPSNAEPENLVEEQYEFSPVPTHVLYDTEEKARERAENLGLEGIHEHQLNEQLFYMAGENHEAWLNAIERENTLDRGEALSDVDLTPPERVVNAAQLALEKDEELDTDCGTGVGTSRANSITNDSLSPEDFLGGENTAIPDYLDSHEEDVTADGPPTDWSDEEWKDCGNLQYAKWGYYLEWFQDKQEELQQAKEQILKGDNMSNEEEQDSDSSAESGKKSEQVTQEAFIDFVAEHMEGLDSADIADAVGDSNFTGLDQGEVANLLAMEFELDPDTVMDAIGQLEDMEGEGYDGKDDGEDDENEEDQGGSEETEEEDSETEGKTEEELKERIDELEEQLETLVKNDEGSSKQESPADSKSEKGYRRPSFRDVLSN